MLILSNHPKKKFKNYPTSGKTTMTTEWPDNYLEFQKKVKEFAIQELNDDIIKRDEESVFSEALWQKCADFGLLGLGAPKQYGGTFEKIEFAKAILAMQGFGYGCLDNGLALALNTQIWTVMITINLFGTDSQKAKYLPKLAAGKWIGCHALTEKESGSDVFSMNATAVKDGDDYILNGEKIYVTLAPIADLAIVFAKTDPSLGKWGISAFIIEKEMTGYSAGEAQTKMGLRTVPFGKITLKDCRVPKENLLGKEGAGLSISNHSLEYDRCCILSSHIGVLKRQLAETIKFAKERKQFGQSIGNFQAVSHRIVSMKLRLETSELLFNKIIRLKEMDKAITMEIALLKLHLSETFLSNSMDAVRIHGGKGYVTEFGIERQLRDAVGGIIYAGTSDIQKNIIAKFLGL